jgi:hypothetical protein
MEKGKRKRKIESNFYHSATSSLLNHKLIAAIVPEMRRREWKENIQE